MATDQVIADAFKAGISHMFQAAKALKQAPTEYTLLNNPNLHPSWFVVLFFPSKGELRTAIENGNCYQVHTYLQGVFSQIDPLKNLERSIWFEVGPQPTDKEGYGALYQKLLKKALLLSVQSEEDEVKTCASCGHDFDAHQLIGFIEEGKAAPEKGWIMCPEEDCTCFGTWGAEYQ